MILKILCLKVYSAAKMISYNRNVAGAGFGNDAVKQLGVLQGLTARPSKRDDVSRQLAG